MIAERNKPGRSGNGGGGDGGGGVRLQRILADAGVASRRICERLIEEGRVKVNGQTVSTLPAFADPRTDRIAVDGKPIPPAERHLYIMLNKPGRVLSTVFDEPGADRKTLATLVDHPAKSRLFPVGRLDFESTGLVLLTNDGDLANRLTHPRYGVPRAYHVIAKGAITPEAAARLERDVAKAERKAAKAAGSTRAATIGIAILKVEPDRTLLEVTLHGRTRSEGGIGALLRSAGLNPKKIERVGLGPLRLRAVAQGQWRELDRQEIQSLRRAADTKRTRPEPPRVERPGGGPIPRPPAHTRPARPARPDRSAKPSSRPSAPQRPPTRASRPSRPAGPAGRPNDRPRRGPQRRPGRTRSDR